MKKIFFLGLVSCFFTSCFAQYDKTRVSKNSHNAFAEANVAMQMGDAESATKMLKKAIEIEPDYCDALILLGDIYHHNHENNKAIELYQKAILIDSVYSCKKYKTLGDIYLEQGNEANAEKYLEKYLSFPKLSPPDKAAAEHDLAEMKFVKEAKAHPVPFEPHKMSNAINSEFDEYYPSMSTDGNTLIFTRRIGRDEDFYISKKINGEWQKAQRMPPPLNSDYNEGALSVTPDNGFVFFTRDCNQTGFGGFDIYISKKSGDKYLTPNNLGEVINSGSKESQPSFSSDGKTLYFMTVRKDGFGGCDLYSSVLTDKGWTTPKNLGTHINTASNEQFPFIHPDNQTFYFVSNGKPGMGLGDIFYSRRKPDGSWGEAINIGYPINTEDDERGIFVTADGKKAIISRAEKGSKNFDLYEFDLYEGAQPNQVTYLKGVITDAKTKKPVGAIFQLIDLSNGNVITESNSDETDGSFLVCIPKGKDYALNVTNDNYLFYSDNFSLKEKTDAEPYLKDVALMPIEVGKSVILKNIFFASNKFDLQTESKAELEKLLAFLSQNKNVKISIDGHTDNSGSSKHNLELSENRAKAVYDYLVSKGIDANRLSYKGFGETKPIADNTTDEGKQQNRRTEITITGK